MAMMRRVYSVQARADGTTQRSGDLRQWHRRAGIAIEQIAGEPPEATRVRGLLACQRGVIGQRRATKAHVRAVLGVDLVASIAVSAQDHQELAVLDAAALLPECTTRVAIRRGDVSPWHLRELLRLLERFDPAAEAASEQAPPPSARRPAASAPAVAFA
jgi:hypothetical protein